MVSRLHLRFFYSWLGMTKWEQKCCVMWWQWLVHGLKRHRQRLLRRTCCFWVPCQLWETIADKGKAWKIPAQCFSCTVILHTPSQCWMSVSCSPVCGCDCRLSRVAEGVSSSDCNLLWKRHLLLSLCSSAWVVVSDEIRWMAFAFRPLRADDIGGRRWAGFQ